MYLILIVTFTFLLNISYFQTSPLALENIKTLFQHDRIDSIGNYIISGEIQNTGTSDMKFLKIIAHLFDSTNQTIAVKDTSADENLLMPGDTTLFTLYIGEDERKNNDLDSYQLSYRWSLPPPGLVESLQPTLGQIYSQNLSLSINSVKVVPVNNESQLEIAFNVYNPNKGTTILETVTYNVYLDNVKLGSGDIGSRTEGFVDSLESVYTIIGNQTIVLRDREPLTEEATSLFDSQGKLITDLVDGSNSTNSKVYTVNGTYSYAFERDNNAQVRESPFRLQFPSN